METSSAPAVKSACDATDTRFKTMNSRAEVVAFSLEPGAVGPRIPADTAATESPAADALEQRDALVSIPPTKSVLAAAALGSTRLIPARPITPFTATTSDEFMEGDEEPSTAADNDTVRPDRKWMMEPDISSNITV